MYKETLGKKLYAYGADKHRPCSYSYVGTIVKAENELIHIHDENNPKGYQDYSITRINFNKWIDEKLYVLR